MPLTWSDLERLGREREQFILAREAALKKTVDELQRTLLSAVYDEILANLITLDDTIVDNDENMSLVGSVDRVYRRFQRDDYNSLVSRYSKDLSNIQSRTADYFRPFTGDKKLFDRINQKSKDTLRALIGIGEGDEVVKDGFIDSFVKDTSVKNRLKADLLKAVVSQSGYQDTLTSTRAFIEGTDPDKYDGALHKHLRTYVYDTYAQGDAVANEVFSDELGLQCAVFGGGVMDTTRDWCRSHTGKVFTKEEIKLWQNKSWAGKNSPYNPFRDRGGYNCRHIWNYVTNEIAIRLRPELKEVLEPKDKRPKLIDFTDTANYSLNVTPDASAFLKNKKLKPNDVIKMSGGVLKPDAKGVVNIRVSNSVLEVEHDFKGAYYAVRNIDLTKKSIYNSYFEAEETGTGIGLSMFTNEVIYGKRYGLKTISCLAARSNAFNGYYTWPTFGYQFKDNNVFERWAKENGRSEKNIRELLLTKDGASLWKENGIGFNAIFNLDARSVNMLDFLRYLQNRTNG